MLGDISGSSDKDEVQLPKEVHSEKSPLLDKPSIKYTSVDLHNQSGASQTENKNFLQYLAAAVVTIGGFIVGTTLGWSATAGPMMEDNQYSFALTEDSGSWIASSMPLGALFSCAFMAVINKMGRKSLLLLLNILTLVGWVTMIYAPSWTWVCVGRFLTGFSSGFYFVVVPLYISEIAEKEIRSILDTYFQLQVNAGILFSFVLGLFCNVYGLSIACAIVPVVYILCLGTLIPESPLFYLKEGNVEKARQSLQFFRGPLSNLDHELNFMQKCLAESELDRIPIIRAFQSIQVKRALLLGLGLMVFQQLTGSYAVIFYATTIIKASGSTLKPSLCTVIIGVVALVSAYIYTVAVDKFGKKILLLYSVIVMGLSTLCLGGYLYLKNINYDVTNIGFIPLLAMCIYIGFFSIGFGPIPWILMGDMFPVQIKGVATSIVCMSHWLFAFLVTKFFTTLATGYLLQNVFFLFTLFSVLGTFFVVFKFPETKTKTMDKI